LGNYKNWSGANEGGGGDRGTNDMDNVPAGQDPLARWPCTRHREIQDMLSAWITSTNREAESHRRKYVSGVVKESWSQLGEGLHTAGPKCPKE